MSILFTLRPVTLILTILMAFRITADAQIVEYTNSTTATTVSSNATAYTLTISNGSMSVTCTGTALRCSAGAFDQLTPTHYLEFKATPQTGYQLDIDKITIQPRRTNAGPTRMRIDYSTDGGMSFTQGPTEVITNPGACIYSTFQVDPVNFAVTSTTNGIIVRAYFWITTGSASGNLDLNSFALVGSVSLPVQLTRFDARKNDRSVDLTFETASETRNDYFEVERSADGRSWETIGLVEGGGDAYTTRKYTFEDNTPLSGMNYYRLRQVDYDGVFGYSPVRSLHFGIAADITLAPTVVADELTIISETAPDADAQWQIIDFSGRILKKGLWPAEQQQTTLSAADLQTGFYVVRVISGQEITARQFRKI